ncbi:ribosomal protein L27 [Terfezia boudieri ATCC MYA-4762]|uniref:Large ribosomal subunit protein bL27m n=1 Tax=Terfezia boudieri ATCC MYA-4762 TaxID=1051890 RepID=A0A3N4LUX0_9PEZI|nr:ribosomal protein L27 [Terfezia boudieri ATCC MYA-4762]
MLPRIFTAGAHWAIGSSPAVPISTLAYSQFLLRPTVAKAKLPAVVSVSAVRWATHKASRPANKGKDGPGKRLGAKKTAGELVKTGHIIFRQRGTLWYPGENASMGRDHTIFAGCPGYVRYYRDPAHPKRKFIGIALTPTQKLPTPPNAATRRRLGRVEVPLVEIVKRDSIDDKEKEVLKSGVYYYRPPNWKLGLLGEELKRPYDPKNTWARWQKRAKSEWFPLGQLGSVMSWRGRCGDFTG